ncbi:MAG: conjugal transfer protein TraX [Blautia sp.]|uniref:TraX family protein n=1 Tax=Blautia sp. TaxID=1955243 RepID=UPI0025BBE95A|nr:TraX family protein [Blautia sp.]MCI6303550.1 conjugal transfer protein TraX [Blautia sp.]
MNMTTGRRGIVWKTPDITADGLKMFACIVMLIQTVGIAVIEKGLIHLDQYTQESLNQAMSQDSRLMTLAGIGSIMQLIGGMAIPVFAVLLVEGFRNTSDYKKYLLTMIITALVSEIPYDLAICGKVWDLSSQNAMITMCICLILLKCMELFSNSSGFAGSMVRILIMIAAIVWVSIFRAEYGLCMVLLVTVFYVFDTKNVLKTVLGCIISLMYVTGPIAFYGIWCYNGERKDRINKYVYYAFYPLHLLVLGVIAKFVL